MQHSPAAQRAPLVDRFGRIHTYLRVSVTDRCNFRCLYCMPEEGIEWKERAEILTFDEIVKLVRIFAETGTTKVRLTGGEPTVRKGIHDLIRMIRDIPGIRQIALTTNGATLAQDAGRLLEAGVTHLNISVDSLIPERFEQITKRGSLPQVLNGIDSAQALGFESVKLNVVVLNGINDDEITNFARFAQQKDLDLRFIEFMPFDSNGWDAKWMLANSEVKRRVSEAVELQPLATPKNAVATEFGIVGSAGKIGFISSMTDDFCAGCDRLRLTADGQMKNCLFSTSESDLRAPLRAGATDDELEAIMRACVESKWAGHPPMGHLERLKNRAMIQIGG